MNDSRIARAVFLDKDTLVQDVPYNVDPERIALLPGVGEALRRLQDSHAECGRLSVRRCGSTRSRRLPKRRSFPGCSRMNVNAAGPDYCLAEAGIEIDAIEKAPT